MTPMVSNAVIVERIDNLKDNLNIKHTQNRTDIHDVRNKIQDTNDRIDETNQELWKLKVKVALYAGGGSALVSGITEIIKLIAHAIKS